MQNRIGRLAIAAAMALAATGSMGMKAQDWPDNLTGYHYVWYEDAAKTVEGGHLWDVGCRGFGAGAWVQRVYVPSGYFDATPIFYCGATGPGPIE